MKIAILSYEYPPDTGFGGIGTYSYYQARALAKLGHDVHVFAGANETGIFESELEGVRVTRVNRSSGWFHRLTQSARDSRARWGINRLETAYAAHVGICKALEKEAFDFIEYPECGGDGSIVSTMLQIPSIVKFHSPANLIMDMYDTAKIDRGVTTFLEQVGILTANMRMSCCRFLADEVIQRMAVPTPVHVVPNGIDLELFDSPSTVDVHKKFGLPRKNATMVFFANRMEKRKGIHLVQDMCSSIMRDHKDVHFVFAGGDPFGHMANEIEPWIKANGFKKRFHYLGKLDLADVRAVLKAIDVFLIPSLWENCPYSCIEAMSASRAIVSSDCGGMPELIQDGHNGVIAKSDDSASFVAALNRVVGDAGLREKLGAEARRTVESRLTDTKIAAMVVDLYRNYADSAGA